MYKNLSEDATIYLEIKQKHGEVTPDVVVREAKRATHPWHSRFTWDDEKAGHQWRLSEARHIISSITVEVKTQERVVIVPMAVRNPLKESNEQGYSEVMDLMKDQLTARRAVLTELSKSISYLERASSLAEAFSEQRLIDKFINGLQELHEKLRSQDEKARA